MMRKRVFLTLSVLCFAFVGLFFSIPKMNFKVNAAASSQYDCLVLTAEQANSTISFNYYSADNIEYSTDGTTWTSYTTNFTITLSSVGSYVKLRGTNIRTGNIDSNLYNFSMTGKIAGSGSLSSFTRDKSGFPDNKLTSYCYSYMFSGCTSLTSAPELPATTLAEGCYSSMFSGCTGLKLYENDSNAGYKQPWGIPSGATAATNWNIGMFFNCPDVYCDLTEPDIGVTYYQKGTSPNYLTFTAEQANSTISFAYDSADSIEYSTNGTTWTLYTGGSTITLSSVGDYVKLRGMNVVMYSISGDGGRDGFSMTGQIAGSGSVTSLTDNNGGDSNVILTYRCYYSMFKDCSSLTSSPELSATMLAKCCYHRMFEGCTSLVSAPALPATTLAESCYENMFADCTNLTSIPDLPATTLAIDCYNEMFLNCTGLKLYSDKSNDGYKKPWGIPSGATTATNWNSRMFEYCTDVCCNSDGPVVGTTYYQLGTPTPNYLTFIAKQANSTVLFSNYSATSIEYSTDGTTWATYTAGSTITLASIGDYVKFRGINVTTKVKTFQSNPFLNHYFMTGKIAGSGSVTSLIDNNGGDPGVILTYQCCYRMFSDCTSLTLAPKLPATTLAEGCYASMFLGCTSLTSAPELPATTLAEGCYASMFSGCTSLTSAPEFPATTLAKNCYYHMFGSCSSLISTPELPATTLAESCYESMFSSCTNLTSISDLPATILEVNCYKEMFQYCTGLKLYTNNSNAGYKMPWGIPSGATTATDWNKNMFLNCTNVCCNSDGPVVGTTYYQLGTVGHSITYSVNGGSGTAPTDANSYNVGEVITLAGQGSISKANYQFMGWNVNQNAKTYYSTYTMIDEDVTFYAIWKKLVIITETAQTYEYDGSSKSFAISGTDSSIGDFTITYFQSSTSVSPTNIGSFEVRLSRAETDDYAAYNKTIADGLIITKKTIIFTVSDKTYTYDNTAKTTDISYTSLCGTDALTYEIEYKLNSSVVSSAINAGLYTVSVKTVSMTSGSSDNYNFITTDTGTITIDKASYSMTGISFSNQTLPYDGEGHGLAISGTLPTGLDGIQVTVSYDESNLVDVDSYDITATFATTSTNYNAPTSMTATLIISAITLTITTNGAEKVYDGSALTATGSYSGLVTGETLDFSATGTITNVGTTTNTYSINWTDSTAKQGNYIITENLGTLKVNKKDITFTVSDKTYTYDNTAKTTDISYTSLCGTDALTYTIEYKLNSSVVSSVINAGLYTVSVKSVSMTSGSSDNYNFITTDTGTITIDKASYSMTGISFSNQTLPYDGEGHSLAISGTLPTGLDGIQVTVSYDESNLVDVDSYDITATFATTSTNYNAPTSMTATLIISAITLTITTNGAEKVYDGSALTATGSYSGLISGETLDFSVTGTITNVGSTTNTYSIDWTDSTAKQGNYIITENLGTLIVNKKDIVFTIVDVEVGMFIYDGTEKTTTAIYTDLCGDDEVSYVLVYDDNINAGTCSVTIQSAEVINGNPNNYNLITDDTGIIVIDKGNYDMSAVMFNSEITYDGLGHSLEVMNLPIGKDNIQVTAVYDKTEYIDAGTYNVNVAFETTSTNYISPESSSVSLTIKPKDIVFEIVNIGSESVANDVE